mmetsp:Transcript_28396/g.31412  ORF Transcript_28396/g.31412 Transcript_28396/m.31412 type:complete len:204 (+) Transcript_28396:53-664(+)|eukprot:CAMPEP_0194133182 /NCGR_PEP_ID=MMETSP0152-20130528/3462_1 /TAXON_ID=1049557 /ORGANISM="Thalassiothrix antarctica, Strain L6-D1" /LENGTH=203 /DNA_ID=CAMNT_0038828449 /DNA_START=53 /DNA_END=664 /DNA_ORIENTATION=+
MNSKSKRCVRFSRKNQIHNVQRLNPNDMWCTERENSESQKDFLSSMMEIQNEEDSTYSHDLLATYSDCMLLSDKPTCPKAIASLVRWSDRRGLEFYAIERIRQERIQQRSRVKQSIIEFQRQLKQEGIKLEDDENNMLAKIAKTLAAPAEVFARTMGQVDAISAKQTDITRQRNSIFVAKRLFVEHQLPVHSAKRMRLSVLLK